LYLNSDITGVIAPGHRMTLLFFIPGLLRMQSPVAYTSCSEQREHNKATPTTLPTL